MTTTTPARPDSEAEVSAPGSRRERTLAERETTAPSPTPAARRDTSVGALLLPPVGSLNPDEWKRPVSRSSTPTYRPPRFDPEVVFVPSPTPEPVVEEAAVAPEPEPEPTPAKPVARKPRVRKAAAKKQTAKKPATTEPVPAEQPVLETAVAATAAPAESVEAVDVEQWRSAAPATPAAPAESVEAVDAEQWRSAAGAIHSLTRQFFAPPDELRPAPVEDQVLETGPDLQLRIYMREILEPWWTGEVGSTTALKRLVALRDSLAEDSTR